VHRVVRVRHRRRRWLPQRRPRIAHIPFPTSARHGHEGRGVVEEGGDRAYQGGSPGHTSVLVPLEPRRPVRRLRERLSDNCRDTFGKTSQTLPTRASPLSMFRNTGIREHTVVRSARRGDRPGPVPSRRPLSRLRGIDRRRRVLEPGKVGRGDTVAGFGVGGSGINAVKAGVDRWRRPHVASTQLPPRADRARLRGHRLLDRARGRRRGCDQGHLTDGVDHYVPSASPPASSPASTCWGGAGNCVIIGVPPPTKRRRPCGREAPASTAAFCVFFFHLGRGYGLGRPQVDVPMWSTFTTGPLK